MANDKFVVTDKEKKAIKALKKLAETWPVNLWLYSASGRLWVMKKKDGQRVITETHGSGGGGVDADFSICSIAIENDGGDW